MSETTAKHTPGPWRADLHWRDVVDARNRVIVSDTEADWEFTHEELDANLRLIAAAPDHQQAIARERERADAAEARVKELEAALREARELNGMNSCEGDPAHEVYDASGMPLVCCCRFERIVANIDRLTTKEETR